MRNPISPSPLASLPPWGRAGVGARSEITPERFPPSGSPPRPSPWEGEGDERRGAFLLDRDGVINRRRPDHVRSWADFEFLPGSLEALCRLRAEGERVLVLTNQAVVGRGLIGAGQLDEIHGRMRDAVEAAGGLIDSVLACVHRPDDRCRCRKPAPGLFHRAADERRVDLRRSVMIGDAWSDVQAAHAAGCRAVWVGPDAGAAGPGAGCVPVARDLLEAVTLLREC